MAPRLYPCEVLRSNGIPSTIWFEDALHHHGSKTIVFSLSLLVPSVEKAATCLRVAGWKPATSVENSYRFHDPNDTFEVLCEAELPGKDDLRVNLLSASDWKWSNDANESYPPIVELYTCLAQRFLETEDGDFRSYLSIQLSYLHGDCDQLSSSEFVHRLPPEIRQFYLDWNSQTMRMSTPKTVEHERKVMQLIREGNWELMDQGSSEAGGTKVDRDGEARLLKMMARMKQGG